MAEVPVTRTTFTVRDYSRAVIRAWRDMLGETPSKAAVGCLWAQYALETGRGAFCWNFNIGNVKWSPGHDHMMLRGTWEIVGGKRVVYEPPHRATWFNAYASLDDAMGEHLRLLKAGRYALSWPAIEAGDTVAFAHALKAGHDGREGTWDDYFTADVTVYAKGLSAFHAEYMRGGDYEAALDDLDAAPAVSPLADTLPELPVEPLAVVEADDTRVIHPVVDTVAEAQRRDE